MFNRVLGRKSSRPTSKQPEKKKPAKSGPIHRFFNEEEAKQIASGYSGLITQDEIDARGGGSVSGHPSPVSLSRSSTASKSSEAESLTEEIRGGSRIDDSKSSESSLEDISPKLERQSQIRATTPGGFKQDFTRGLYSFYDVTAAGTLEEQKLTIDADEPEKITASLSPYFREEGIAKQSQRIGQALAMGVLTYLRRISTPYNSSFHVDFIRVKGHPSGGACQQHE